MSLHVGGGSASAVGSGSRGVLGSGSPGVVAQLLSVAVRAYRAVTANRPSPCGYWPTCSAYALEALETHGAIRGGWLTVRRLLRCHPWTRHERVDPVPERVAR